MKPPKFPGTLPAEALTPPATGEAEPIDFTPVPRLRAPRSGGTEPRQRAFIAAPASCSASRHPRFEIIANGVISRVVSANFGTFRVDSGPGGRPNPPHHAACETLGTSATTAG